MLLEGNGLRGADQTNDLLADCLPLPLRRNAFGVLSRGTGELIIL